MRFVQGRLFIPGCQSVLSMKEKNELRLTPTWILLLPSEVGPGETRSDQRGRLRITFKRDILVICQQSHILRSDIRQQASN